MKTHRLAYALVALACLIGNAARAQALLSTPPGAGTVVSVEQARLALPPGSWQPVPVPDDTAQFTGNASLGTSGKVARRAFMLADNGKVGAFLLMATNELPSQGGWTMPRECTRQDVLHNKSTQDGRLFDCLWVNHEIPRLAAANNEIMTAIRQAAAPLGGGADTWISAQYRLATHLNYLSVTIYFNPELAGFAPPPRGSWSESPWNKVRASPDHVAYLTRVATWAEAYRAYVRKALP